MSDPRRESATAGSDRGIGFRGVVLLFVAALAVRVIHLYEMRASPFAGALLGDAAGYDAWARRIAAGDWMGEGVFYQAPLYPYFLGVVYRCFGADLFVVRVIQAVLGSFAAVFLARAGARWFDARVGRIAGWLIVFYPPAIFFDGLIQKTSLDLFLLCAFLWATSELGGAAGRSLIVGTGAILGFLILTRENAMVLVPVTLLWFVMRRGRRVESAALFMAGLLVVLSPVVWRNWQMSREFHPTTAQFGPNFFIGNHEGASGTYEPLRRGRGNVRYEQEDARALAEAQAGRPLGAAEVSAYWTGRALSWIVVHPDDWLKLAGRKALLAWNALEATDTEDIDSHAEWSTVLRATALIFNWGVLAALGVAGAWMTRARFRELWILHAWFAAYVATLIAFYVVARYRFPLAPFVALFAAAALGGGREWWRAHREKGRGALVAITISAFAISQWPLLSRADMRSLTLYNLADEARARGRAAQAIGLLRDAIALSPRNSGALSNLGALLSESGHEDEAMGLYERAIEADPANSAARVNLGQAQVARGRFVEAIANLRSAVQLDPRNVGAHIQLGLAFASAGDPLAATDSFQEAIRIDPTNPEAHNNLGIVLCANGLIDEGIEQFEEALRFRPDFKEAAANLERARALASGTPSNR
jgi:Tfp pilus assembly protein PilF